MADTILNNFKHIISVNLHDNPNSGYFPLNLQKKLKLQELMSEQATAVRLYPTQNSVILKINQFLG